MSGNSDKNLEVLQPNGMNWPSENKGARSNPDSLTTPGKFLVGTPHKIKPVGIIGGSTRT
jgi:hypothetical protein